MAWRKHETHREESKAVREALRNAGINARVSHSTGTGWTWLKINVGEGNASLRRQVLRIAQGVTGRHGEYDGNINVFAQDHWDKKRQCPVPILQTGQKEEAQNV